MDNDEYTRLLAHLTVIERALIALAQQQPAIALNLVRAELSQLAQDSEQSTEAYGETVGQVAARLLDELR